MTTPPMPTPDIKPIPLPQMFQRYRASISSSLRDGLSQQHSDVYDMLRYYMGWVDENGRPHEAMEGKALRPTLCLFACEAVGGAVEMAMPSAIALEFIHNFSLIHDDIQDRDETRHNRKTLWAVWGDPKALVAGNVLRVVADECLHQLLDSGLDYDRALSAGTLLTEAYLEMIEGQYLDLQFEGRHDIAMSDYLNMISRKTGALIRCSLNLGAVVGAREAGVGDAFKESGRAMGYVFQIIDDVLGVWGDEETTGKPVGADIRRKKNSYPVVYAMEMADHNDRRMLNEIYEKDELDDADVESVLAVMDRLNVKNHAQREAEKYADVAMEYLAPVELSSEARREVEDLAHFLLVRDR
ncbi:MAG: polyprenyl synthetase family protein [SAR202 cluster bacterium]|nr:polyprenyl synthetase family protein [SAR202 cluster bacterium]MDP6714385.1 polyprenyl synthetase family protein [SAR202 cluster bacterium]